MSEIKQCRVCLTECTKWRQFCTENLNIEGHNINLYLASQVSGTDLMKYWPDETAVACKNCENDIKALYRFSKLCEKSLEYFKEKENDEIKAGSSMEPSCSSETKNNIKKLQKVDKRMLVNVAKPVNSCGHPIKSIKVNKNAVKMKAGTSLKRPGISIQTVPKLQKFDEDVQIKEEIDHLDGLQLEPKYCEDNLILKNQPIGQPKQGKTNAKRSIKQTLVQLNDELHLSEIMKQSKIDLEDTSLDMDTTVSTAISATSTSHSVISSELAREKPCHRCGFPLSIHYETKCKLFGYGFSEHFIICMDDFSMKCRQCLQVFSKL